MESFELYIFSFGLFGFDLCSLAARALVAFELTLGLGLASGMWRRTMNWTCAAMLGAFSLFLLWRLALGDKESCHCFGDVLDMNPAQSLLKNAAMGALLALGWNSPKRDLVDMLCRFAKRLRPATCRIAASLAVIAAAFSLTFAVCPPSIYFRMHRKSVNISEEMWRPYSDEFGFSEGREVVLFLSPVCEHCQHCARKFSTILERHQLDTSRIHIVFMDVADKPEDMSKLIDYFYGQAGVPDPGLDTRTIPFEKMIPMTDGVLPLVCLFEDGALVKEYGYSSLSESSLAGFLPCGD